MDSVDRAFFVRASALPGGSCGLFARRDLKAGETFACVHSRARSSDTSARSYVIDAFVRPDVDAAQTRCVWDGRVCDLASVRHLLRADALRPKFVHMPKDSLLMRANDLAWRDGVAAEAYVAATELNQLDLVLGFHPDGRFERVYATLLRDVASEEEVGITYGAGFWFDEAALPEPAPAPTKTD